MDDLFGRLAADLGVDRTATEMAGGILLRFQKEGPAETVHAALPRTPGLGAVMPMPTSRPSPANVLGARGNLMGFTVPIRMAGLSADHVGAATRECASAARVGLMDDGADAGAGDSFDV